MQSVKKEKYFIYGERILFLGFFLAAWLLCGQISYSNGDDAYFSTMAHSMPFWEYLKMRYIGWEGRMTSEAMTYLAFYFGKSFWQLANAWMLAMLPYGLIRITKKMAGDMQPGQSFFTAFLLYVLTLSLDVMVIGYGAFWITGSTFYLWSIVAGIWAAMPFVDLVYDREKRKKRSFFYGIPCAWIAAMGQEQIAAVVIAFGVLAVGYEIYKNRKVPAAHLLEILLMIVSLILVLASPGTDARTQSEIENWMPQYHTMSVGNHIFITVQWMLSSFANEGKILFCVIWIFAALLLLQKKERKGRILAVFAAVAALISLFPLMGITFFSEMGMGVEDYAQCVYQVATPFSLNGQNWLALLWWAGMVLLTLILLWEAEESLCKRMHLLLLVLAACASEAIMFFSPTMYVSGTRIYFTAQVLLWLAAGILGEKLIAKGRLQILVIAGTAGILNVACSVGVVLSYLS